MPVNFNWQWKAKGLKKLKRKTVFNNGFTQNLNSAVGNQTPVFSYSETELGNPTSK